MKTPFYLWNRESLLTFSFDLLGLRVDITVFPNNVLSPSPPTNLLNNVGIVTYANYTTFNYPYNRLMLEELSDLNRKIDNCARHRQENSVY